MHGDWLGVIWTVVLILFCWTVAYFIKLKEPLTDERKEFARKVVHIGVSNWYFIYCRFFTSWIFPVGGLAFFALVNFLIEKYTGERRSWGTVYFPFSIIVMIAMKELGFGSDVNLGAGILGMGYADGLAALVGRRYGNTKMIFCKNKTVVGCETVLLVSGVIVFILTGCTPMVAFIIGIAAMICEAYTPAGLDNISVPLVIYILSTLLC